MIPPATPPAGRAEGPSEEAMTAAKPIVAAVHKTLRQLGHTQPEKPETVTALEKAFATIIDSALAPSRATTQELSEAVERVVKAWLTPGLDIEEWHVALNQLSEAHARSGLVSNTQRKGGV